MEFCREPGIVGKIIHLRCLAQAAGEFPLNGRTERAASWPEAWRNGRRDYIGFPRCGKSAPL
jgi:hypothetical protein